MKTPNGSDLARLFRKGFASLMLACVAPAAVLAATPLADKPLFANQVPGNLALALSVEFPTAISVAHPGTTYTSTETYLGYFDPSKCYAYKWFDVETATDKIHFEPAGVATARTCTGVLDHLWSGNFLNWATMQTIDPFRWALTGGYRVVDEPTMTLLEKAWGSPQGANNNFPRRTLADASAITGATPFLGTAAVTADIWSNGQNMRVATGGTGGLIATYFNGIELDANGVRPVLTRIEGGVFYDWTNGSPHPSVNVDNFSARWVGTHVVPTTGNYRFRTRSDDGVRLFINGVRVINRWDTHAPTTDTTADIALVAGAPLHVRLEYFESQIGAVIELQWLPPGAGSYTTYAGSTDVSIPVRVKVCDPAVPGGVERNCKAYASGGYKPEGLIQQYSKNIRFSAFSYLNDPTDDIRDGGVLRAQQKFVGPEIVRPGLTPTDNVAKEWDTGTGVMRKNPDATDATNTNTRFGVSVTNSGVINYVNKFGREQFSYKRRDPVSELYYGTLRYLKNQGPVNAWTSGIAASANKNQLVDGFPVITDWQDPIQYACQRNFVLGVGDTNTNWDRNLPGATGGSEPAKPAEVTADEATLNTVTVTNRVGVMQGMGASLGTTGISNGSYLISGLAYDANTRDIRPDDNAKAQTQGLQTVQTFWLDVLEFSSYASNNQYYLAAKYGGFKVPQGYNPVTATAALPEAWWRTNTDLVGTQPRPDNYYTASRPDQMVNGLTQVFASIASSLRAYTTSFSTSSPSMATAGTTSYGAQFDAGTWTGELTASTSTFDATTGVQNRVTNWSFSSKLAEQVAGTGWDTQRRVVTWDRSNARGVPFRAAAAPNGVPADQLALLDTVYRAGNDSADYLNYLRGEPMHEENSTAVGSTRTYRTRPNPLGDIVGSRPRVVGPPSATYSNAANPGYTAFKTTAANATRKTMVYVGSNGGMLHAIDGSITGITAGAEVFAFVPGALYAGPTGVPRDTGLQSIGDPEFTHHYFVDSSPAVFDIDLGRTVGGTGTNWRSVLVGGLGKGGKSYYAIDVTDPSTMTSEAAVASKVMWEFSHADLGYTYGEPTAVKTRRFGWVLVFGSGYNNSDGKGYFFIVNPRTGELLDKIGTGAGGGGVDAGMAHVQTFVQDRTDNTVETLYAGDLLGNLWRLDLSGNGAYPAPVKIATLTDSADQPLPVTSRPLVVLQPRTNRRYVTVGTGRLLASSDIASSQSQNFYAIIDGSGTAFNTAARLPAGITFPITRAKLRQLTDLTQPVTLNMTTQIGWYFDLGATAGQGWRVIADPTSFYGTVAFSTNLPSGDACNASGSSRIYAIDLGTGQSQLANNVPFIGPTAGSVTDLRYYSTPTSTSTQGPVLVVCTDTGTCTRFNPPTPTLGLRRLNWRELLLAD